MTTCKIARFAGESHDCGRSLVLSRPGQIATVKQDAVYHVYMWPDNLDGKQAQAQRLVYVMIK
jgi:hypothetical protein